MLNYVDQNSTCMNLLIKNGINISDKNSLKAAASMSAAKADLLNNVVSYQGCVLPSEAFSTFGTNSSCTIANNYNLIHTKPGVLSADTDIQSLQLQNGEATYPVNGCLYNINSKANPVSFMKDAGNVLDQENKAEIDRLTQILNQLKADCSVLDQDIIDNTKFLSDTQRKLANQQAICRGYVQGIVATTTNINNIKNIIANNTLKVENLKFTHNKKIQDAKNMVIKCNRDIRHCFITENCTNGGNFSTINNLVSDNSRGRVQKIKGYIPNLNVYQFDRITKSLIIPPGIEVRVFDDIDYLGGNTDFISNIDETDIKKLDRSCLVNETYNQNIIKTDNLGNITVDNEKTNWNNKIRSIRVRRAQDYSFEPTGVIEAYTNYEDKVDAPLIYKEDPGSIDVYFSGQVDPSIVSTSSKDYLAAYTKKAGMKVGNSSVTSTKSYDRNNPELLKYKYSATQLSTDVPLQNCAKECDNAGAECAVFTFDPSKTSCDLLKSRGGPLVLMNKPNLTTYVKSGTPIQDNMALPEGPYKNTADLDTGIYDGRKLQIDLKKNTGLNNSTISTKRCVIGSIDNANGDLKCKKTGISASLLTDGLRFFALYGQNQPITVNDFVKNYTSSGFSTEMQTINGATQNAVVASGKTPAFVSFENHTDWNYEPLTIVWMGYIKVSGPAVKGDKITVTTTIQPGGVMFSDSAPDIISTMAKIKAGNVKKQDVQIINPDPELDNSFYPYYPVSIVYYKGQGGMHFNTDINISNAKCTLSYASDPSQKVTDSIKLVNDDDPFKKSILVEMWEHPWTRGHYARFILPGGKDEITFKVDDKDENGREIGWRWLIGQSSSMRINAKPDECEVTLIDKNGEKIMLRQNSEWLMDLGYIKGDWNDRAKQMIIKRL